MFKNNIPGLDLQDMRSYSAVTIELWIKFNRSVFDNPDSISTNSTKDTEIVKMIRVDYQGEDLESTKYMILTLDSTGNIYCKPHEGADD